MSRSFARRLIATPIVLFLTSLLAFAIPQLTGRDTVRSVLTARFGHGYVVSDEVLRDVRERLGLDEAPVARYLDWLSRVMHGDLGESYVTSTPVGSELLRSAVVSLSLIAVAVGVAFLIGVPAGVVAARHRGSLFDRVVGSGSRFAASVPEYVLGPVLVVVFAVNLGLLPSSGWRGPSSLVLPAITLAAYPVALFAQLARAETLDALEQPFITTGRAKGIGESRLLWVHAARTAMTGVVSIGSLILAGAIGAGVIVEVIFAVPGLGRLLVEAVLANDVPMIQGGLLLAVGIAMLLGLAADVLQRRLDPVARLGRAK